MSDHQLLELTTAYPKVVVGKPLLPSPDLTVENVLSLLAQGLTPAELAETFGGLNPEAIEACVLFANQSLRGAAEAETEPAQAVNLLWL